MKTLKLLVIVASAFIFALAGCAGENTKTLTGSIESGSTFGTSGFRLVRDGSGAKVACGSANNGLTACTALIPGKDQAGGPIVAAACSDPTDGWCGFTLSADACAFEDNADGSQDYKCTVTPCLDPVDCDDSDSATQDICVNDGQVNGICYHPGLACTVGSGACANTGVKEKDSTGAWICNVAAKPAGTEICDGVDNDCDGLTDEENAGGCTQMYTDADGDGHGAGAAKCLCGPSGQFSSTLFDDCKDTDAAMYPGNAEVCDGKDNNCDGQVDETYTDLGQACTDGLGECFVSGVKVCKPDKSGTTCSVAALPGAASEACNDKDDTCDGTTDEGCDDDNDDWCDVGLAMGQGGASTCSHGGGDCNDADSSINPGQAEACNAKDDNCNGQTDEGFNLGQACTDGLGECYMAGTTVCKQDESGSQCSVSAKPAGTESCDGKDNDCDGATDEENATGCSNYFGDADGDDYGVGVAKCLCAPGMPYTALVGTDCNDADSAIHPAATEMCDGVDNNCDGQTDEGCDADQDGYCTANMTTIGTPAVCPMGGGDCNDADSAIHPAATETCNAKDDNCDGQTDEGSVCSPTASPTQISCGQTLNVNTGTDLNVANTFTSWEVPGQATQAANGKEELFQPMVSSGTWTFACTIDATKTALAKTKLRIVLLKSSSATPDKDANGDGTKETGSTDMVAKLSFSSVAGTFGVNKWVYVDTYSDSPVFVGTCTLTCSP